MADEDPAREFRALAIRTRPSAPATVQPQTVSKAHPDFGALAIRTRPIAVATIHTTATAKPRPESRALALWTRPIAAATIKQETSASGGTQAVKKRKLVSVSAPACVL